MCTHTPTRAPLNHGQERNFAVPEVAPRMPQVKDRMVPLLYGNLRSAQSVKRDYIYVYIYIHMCVYEHVHIQ